MWLACVFLGTPALLSARDESPKTVHALELPFTAPGGHVRNAWVGYGPNGKHLAAHYVFKGREYVAIWDGAGKLLYKIDAGELPPLRSGPGFGAPLVFTADEKYLVYLTPGKANFFNLADGKLEHSAWVPNYKFKDEMYTALVSADDKVVRQVTYGMSVEETWHLSTCASGKDKKFIDDQRLSLPAALAGAVSPDFGSLAWIPGAGVIGPNRDAPYLEILDLKTKRRFQLREEKPMDGLAYTALAYSSDGNALAGGNAAGGVALWKPTQEKPLWVWAPKEPERSIGALAFSGDGKALAAGTYDLKGKPNVLILSTANGKLERAWSDNDGGVRHLAWHPQKRQLAVLGGLKVTVYDLPAPK
jgi:WD40 repeat protein